METRQQDFSFRLTGKGSMVLYLLSCDLDRWPSGWAPCRDPPFSCTKEEVHMRAALYINSSLDFCLFPPASLLFRLWMPHPKDFLFHAPAVCLTEMFQPGMPCHCPSCSRCFLSLLTNTLRGSHVNSFSHLSSVRAGTLSLHNFVPKDSCWLNLLRLEWLILRPKTLTFLIPSVSEYFTHPGRDAVRWWKGNTEEQQAATWMRYIDRFQLYLFSRQVMLTCMLRKLYTGKGVSKSNQMTIKDRMGIECRLGWGTCAWEMTYKDWSNPIIDLSGSSLCFPHNLYKA